MKKRATFTPAAGYPMLSQISAVADHCHRHFDLPDNLFPIAQVLA